MNKSMKKNSRRGFLFNSVFAGFTAMGLASCESNASGVTATATDTKEVGNNSGPLTDEQKDELFYIYQEEKVARDAYITLGKKYTSENTFRSIQKSEQRHIDSARGLCEKYGIDISGVDEGSVGNFVIDVLQELYDTVISEGEKSLLDALTMGELIEVTDIEDLRKAIEDMGMPDDVVRVYENLREGSYNHLESFQVAIARA